MAFNPTNPEVQYVSTAGQTVFPFSFKIYETGDIEVYRTNVIDGTIDKLTETFDYTVTINGDAGGEVTFLSPQLADDKIVLKRNLEFTRDTNYIKNGDLFAETINNDQNYQTYLIADLNNKFNNAVVLPDGTAGINTSLPSPEADQYIRWNSTGDGLVNDETYPNAIEDARRWAYEEEDSQITDNEGNTGYSARHYAAKT